MKIQFASKILLRFLFCVGLLVGLMACSLNRGSVEEAPLIENGGPINAQPGRAAQGEGGLLQNRRLAQAATLNTAEVLVIENSGSARVNLLVSGSLPDTCARLEPAQPQRTESGFALRLITSHPLTQTEAVDSACAPAAQPFEETIPLDVVGFSAGRYTVTLSSENDLQAGFLLQTDVPTPILSTAASLGVAGVVAGVVWDDVCQLLADGTPVSGCVPTENGAFQADGIFTRNETGLPNIEVTLNTGACPSQQVLLTTTTDEAGRYQFADLTAGTYCVAIDTLTGANRVLLLPGQWSLPPGDIGQVTVNLAEDGSQQADFGWARLLPPASSPSDSAGQAANEAEVCVNTAAYEADVTIPDGTVLTAGASFVKTWQIRNDGTCTWTTAYRLVSVGETPLSQQSEVALSAPLAPGESGQLSVPLTAPTTPGTYRSDWLLQAPDGTRFGSLGANPFYVEIVVN